MEVLAIGVDPGKNGGIAMIDNGLVISYPYSDEKLILCLKGAGSWKQRTPGREVRICVEKVGAMPGQGVVSMFNFGKSLGFIEGVIQAFGLSYQLVPPQTWKKEFSLTGDKSNSIDVCRKLFPGVNLLATERCTKPHDGMAEAILMAEYARRKF
jgi:crossover junction endodeoxyribonuclease RuvC